MRTIKSIVKEYNKKYKLNYDSTLSKNNIGFAIVDTEAQDLDNEKENIDIRNLDIDLDFIDIKLLVNDYKSETIDFYLEEIINNNVIKTEGKNLLDFRNFIVRKIYEIVKKRLEEEKNMFIQEREKRFNLLDNKEKRRRLFKDKKIERNTSRNYFIRVFQFDWDSRKEGKYRYSFTLEFINYLNKEFFDTQILDQQLLNHFKKEEFNTEVLKDKLNRYIEFVKENYKDKNIKEKINLLIKEYDKTIELIDTVPQNQDYNFLGKLQDDENIKSFYNQRKNEINQKLDEIDFKLKQGELETSEIEDSKERQALITEINEKSSTLKSLQEQTANLEKQKNKDNRTGWIIIE